MADLTCPHPGKGPCPSDCPHLHTKAGESRPRVGKAAAAATPPEFREALLSMARSVAQERVA